MRIGAAAALLALGAAFATAPAASASGDCSAAVQTDCRYCARYAMPIAEPASNCQSGSFGYSWQQCALLVRHRCVQGSGPAGRKCAFNATTDVTGEPGREVGDLNGGPLYTGAAGTLHCSIVVNGNNHSAPAAAGATAPATGGVALVAQPAAFAATAADDLDVCTAWVPDAGPALYWVAETADPRNSYSAGYWSTDATSRCGPGAMDLEPDDPTCNPVLTADSLLGTDVADIWEGCENYPPLL